MPACSAPPPIALGLTDKTVNLLADFDTAFWSIIVMVVWKIAGFTMIILLTGLQAIPTELQEAARIDGASRWQRFRRITLPLMRRTIALALILSVAGSMLAFDQFYIILRGGPQNQTITAVYWIFNQSFVSFKLGYGAALSMVLLVILVALSLVQLWLLRAAGGASTDGAGTVPAEPRSAVGLAVALRPASSCRLLPGADRLDACCRRFKPSRRHVSRRCRPGRRPASARELRHPRTASATGSGCTARNSSTSPR